MEQDKSIMEEFEDSNKAHFSGPLPEGGAYQGENIRKNYYVICRAAAEWGAKWMAEKAGIKTYMSMGSNPLASIKAEFVFEFESFNAWVNNASGLFANYSREEKIICLDSNGNGLSGGKDFMHCRDHNLFPVKCYRLIRTSEAV